MAVEHLPSPPAFAPASVGFDAAAPYAAALRLMRRHWRRIAIFLAPWLLAVGVAVPLLWMQIENAPRDSRAARSQGILRSAEDVVRRVFDRLGRDIIFLGALTARLPPRDLDPNAVGGQLFVSFTANSPDYDQVRWIDESGWERLRVDQTSSGISAVPQGELEDRSDSPFFRDARSLPRDGIYFSAFDRVFPAEPVPWDRVPAPLHPVLQVATPVMSQGLRSGVVVIDYTLRTLLERLQRIAGTDPGVALYLTDGEGRWISGPRGAALRLPEGTPDLWAQMMQAPSGEWRERDVYWQFRRLDLGSGLVAAGDASVVTGPGTRLFLVLRMDESQAEQRESVAKVILSLVAGTFLLMVLVVAVRLAGSLEREARQTRALKAANAALTDANRHLEEAQRDIARAERLSSLGLMVAGVAHELNTPLGVATLSLSRALDAVATLESRLASGLRRSDLDAFLRTGRGDVALALDALHRCADLVRRFKQVATDRATVARRRMDLAETIHDADPRLRRWDATAGVTLSLDLEEGVEMDSYPGPLQQVVSNLLGNALKHAFPKDRHGTVTVRARAEGPDHVRIAVEDDGVGIPSDALPRVFEPFFTTARALGGTGLGLHIVHQIVTELLGGRVEVVSPPPGGGSGTRTTLILPRIAPEQPPGAHQP